MLGQHIVISDDVVLHRSGVLYRVGRVDAVHVLGQQNHVGVDLRRPQHRRSVRGEVGIAGACAEDHHPALLQVPDGPGTDVGLRHSPHLNGGLHPDGNPLLLTHVRHSQAVHHRGQHSHVVGPGALHGAAAVFRTAPEVAAAHHQTYLDAHVQTLLDDIADLTNHLKIQAGMLVTGQGLAADLQQDPFIHRLRHDENLRLFCSQNIIDILAYFSAFA